jgi:Adenylate and Guanylate cyclase catalytic domain
MESTGKPWKIHASEATAELLRQAGKGDWLRAREELVEAKGKGTMQTYWVELRGEGTLMTRTTEGSSEQQADCGGGVFEV